MFRDRLEKDKCRHGRFNTTDIRRTNFNARYFLTEGNQFRARRSSPSVKDFNLIPGARPQDGQEMMGFLRGQVDLLFPPDIMIYESSFH